MSSQFPPLQPADQVTTYGDWPTSTHQAMDGQRSIIRHGSAEIGRGLSLPFVGLTEAEYLQVVSHYRGHRSGFDSWTFTTTTLAADLTLTGYAWQWASPPKVTDQYVNFFDIECQFRMVPIQVAEIKGVNWISPASSLQPGSMLGFYAFGAGVTFRSAASVLYRVQPDPYFDDVSLLLKFREPAGSTTFTDLSTNNLTVTGYGDAVIRHDYPKFSGGSLYLDGAVWFSPTPPGGYIVVTASPLMDIGGKAFTAELFYRRSQDPPIPGSSQIFPIMNCKAFAGGGGAQSGISPFRLDAEATYLKYAIGNADLTNWAVQNYTTEAFTPGVYTHVAVCGDGTTVRVFFNGVLVHSMAQPAWGSANRGLTIGYNGADYGFGDYAEVRFTLNRARYLATFNPPPVEFGDA